MFTQLYNNHVCFYFTYWIYIKAAHLSEYFKAEWGNFLVDLTFQRFVCLLCAAVCFESR